MNNKDSDMFRDFDETDIESTQDLDVSDTDGFISELSNQPEDDSPKKSSVAKLLAQRNEARKQAQQYREMLEQQKAQIDAEQDIKQKEIDIFYKKKELYKKYDDFESIESRVEDFLEKNNSLDYETAYKLVKYEMMTDETIIAKQNQKKSLISGKTPSNIRNFKNFDNMNLGDQLDFLKNQFKQGKLKI